MRGIETTMLVWCLLAGVFSTGCVRDALGGAETAVEAPAAARAGLPAPVDVAGADAAAEDSSPGPVDSAAPIGGEDLGYEVAPDVGSDTLPGVWVGPDAEPSRPDASVLGASDAPDAAASEDDGPDASAPHPACGTCELGTGGCLDEKTGFDCIFATPPGGSAKCVYPYVKTCPGQGTCVGRPPKAGWCDCPETGEDVCVPYGTTSTKKPLDVCGATGPATEVCPFPGCWQGECITEDPPVEILWPIPTPHELRSVEVLGPDHILTVGAKESLFEWQDGEWTDVRERPEIQYFVHVQRDETGQIHIVSDAAYYHWGGEGTLEEIYHMYLYPAEGGGWMNGAYQATSAWVVAPELVYVTTTYGGLGRIDGGSWTWITTGYEEDIDHALRSIWARSPEDIWVVGDGGTARHFDGTSWQAVHGLSVEAGGTAEDLGAVRGTAGGELYVTRGRTLLRRTGTEWTAMYEAPEEGVVHEVWVGATDDIWVWGQYVLSHWDGEAWTTWSTGYEGTVARLLDLDCGADGVCWATGQGLALRFEAGVWEPISKGMGELPGFVARTTSGIWAASPEEVFTVISGPGTASGMPTGPYDHDCFARRHLLEDGVVVEVETTNLGPQTWGGGSSWDVRGLWGTSRDNVFVASRTPKHFDGETWAPLDLPADILEDYMATVLTGRADDLYIALASKVFGSTLVAHRDATGGPWTFVEGPIKSWIGDLWITEDGQLYAYAGFFTYRLWPDGEWESLISNDVGTPMYVAPRIGVTRTGIHMLAYGMANHPTWPLATTTPDGLQYDKVTPFGAYGGVVGITLPPWGTGFLLCTGATIVELATGEQGPLGPDTTFADYKPYAYVESNTKSMHLTPWGDLFAGSFASLHRMDSPYGDYSDMETGP